MKILRWLGVALLVLVAIGAVVYATRTDPLWMIAGRQLTGEVVTDPVEDWSFTDEHMLIAVETRPAAPHSVTTICFTHDGDLYVPAQSGATKSWTHFAMADPRVRLKIGGRIYPARATRVLDPSLAPDLIAAARAKYDLPEGEEAPSLDDVWVFRMESAPAAATSASASGAGAATPTLEEIRALAERVVAAPDRSEEDRDTDERRRPVDLLTFAGVRPGMRVADIGSGAGYTAELLARAVGPGGVVYGQNTPWVIEKYVADSWPERLSKEVMANAVRIDSAYDAPLPGVSDLDLVTMVFVYHDTLYQEVDRARMDAALFDALAPGGSLVVVDHRAAPGSGEEVGQSLHRIDEALLRREMLRAGFQLAEEADFLANAEDPRAKPFFELDFPTDAFVHRYVKPR